MVKGIAQAKCNTEIAYCHIVPKLNCLRVTDSDAGEIILHHRFFLVSFILIKERGVNHTSLAADIYSFLCWIKEQIHGFMSCHLTASKLVKIANERHLVVRGTLKVSRY